MTAILLTTLNARYIHASLGLRYLLANMQELTERTELREYEINTRVIDIAEDLLRDNPSIIGIGVYIWNITQTLQLTALIKAIAPQTILIAGGPEVSHETQDHPIWENVDYVITGNADFAFRQLCQSLLRGEPQLHNLITAPFVHPNELTLPYHYYTDEDIAHRVLYVEASRGCPFKCEFCLSSLDKTSWPFDLEQFLQQMETLYQRGARQFKFVDRTFNLKAETGKKILDFFLARMSPDLFLHFEMIPDHLPNELKQLITQFPPGSLQFEIGIQTFNPKVQQDISRKQHHEKTIANLSWLREQTQAHLHVDLIIGLPGEDLFSFAQNFDTLVGLRPHEIQVGILKRLRGTPIIRHTDAFNMIYNPQPPYNILATDCIDFPTMQRLARFARYWDMIGNSGHFLSTRAWLLQDSPFQRFLALSDWLYQQTHQTHKLALKRLYRLIYNWLCETDPTQLAQISASLLEDYQRSGIKGRADFLHSTNPPATQAAISQRSTPNRQKRHLGNH